MEFFFKGIHANDDKYYMNTNTHNAYRRDVKKAHISACVLE